MLVTGTCCNRLFALQWGFPSGYLESSSLDPLANNAWGTEIGS